MLPVSVLPAAAILLGIGYWIDPSGWGGESPIAAFLITAGSSLIDFMPILFAVGVALGMSKDNNGASAMSGLVGYLVVTNLLSPDSVAMLQSIEVEAVDAAFGNIENQFIGILVGAIAGAIYNKFSETRLPQALAFFSGRRLPPIITAMVMLVLSLILMFIWPPVYNGLVGFGTAISDLGALGAGIYGFFNRLLIPVGLHHALNSVFWFDVAGINDIGNFWAGTGEVGVTGMYQAGFFPVMMFGLPAAGFAMYQLADEDKKAETASLMMAAGFASFLTGVTEPLEFAFMFIAPQLYLLHAIFTGISLFISAFFGWTAGFGFSAGMIDFVLSFNLPLANMPYMLLLQGAVFAVIYYVGFRWAITQFDIQTPGRGVDVGSPTGEVASAEASDASTTQSRNDGSEYARQAQIILDGLGGPDNLDALNYCATRLRVDVNDINQVDEGRIKEARVPGTNITGGNHIQVIVGTEVQFVADEIEKLRMK
jgi:PTS system N-acetylglucosamine-specific IIC component